MVVAVVLRFSSWSPSLLSYGNPNRTRSLAEAFLVLISMKNSRVFQRVHYVVHPSVLIGARGQEMVDVGD